MKRVAILGAGDLGKQVLIIVNKQKKYEPVGFFDDIVTERFVEKLPILGKKSDIEELYAKNIFDLLFVAIGYNHLKIKQEIIKELAGKIPFANIIHPNVVIEENVVLEEGILIYPNVYIGNNSIIKRGSVINVGSILPHDNTVNECAFISVGIMMGGNTSIGKRSFIGVGTSISDGISISDDIIIGTGSTIIKDIQLPGTYVGCPVRKIK